MIVAIVALVVVAAAGLVVSFGGGPGTVKGEDTARGERLEATFVVQLEDRPVSDAAATLELTNTSERPAWYENIECSGPSEPWIGPAGARGQGGVATEGPLRDRLIAAGVASRVVALYPTGDQGCDPGGGAVEVGPGETVTFEYRSGTDPVDRSSELRAVASVSEVDRRGRSLGRLRLVVALEADSDAPGTTVDQVVDAFLADPSVTAFVVETGEDGLLAHVAPDESGWRISVSTSDGHLAAEVHPDLTVVLTS